MPLHIGDAYIKILVQMDGLIKGMREAESITRQSAAGMQSALDGSAASMQQLEQAAQQTRSAAGWLGAALGGLSAAGMVAMKGIADTAMRTQELGIVLEVVARNAGVAEETTARLEAEMKELGMTTQAARTIIAQMIQTNVDLSKGTDLVRTAQDMAVISMQDSSTAAQDLMRAIVTMNPILLKKFGIMTGLEDIDRRAGEALGILSYETEKSGKTVKKWTRDITAAERQQAIFNMILAEGAKFSGTYTEAMEAPGKAMRSFSRYIMEAQEAVGQYWLPVINQAIGVASKLIKAFNEAPPALQKFIAIALPVGTALASLAGSALILYSQWGKIQPVIQGVTTLLSGLVAPVAAVIAIVATLAAAWHFNWFGIQEITASVVSFLQETFETLVEYFKMVIQEGEELNVWLFKLPEPIQPIIQSLGKFVTILQDLIKYFASVIQKGDILTVQFFDLPKPIQSIIKRVEKFIKALRDLDKYLAPILDIIHALADTVLPPLQAAFKSIRDTISKELGPVLDNLRELWEAIGPVVKELAEILGAAIVIAIGVLGALVAGLAEGFSAAFDDILRVVQGVIKIITGILEAFGGLLKWLTGLVTGNLEDQEAGWQMMKDGVAKIVEGLKMAVINAFRGMIDFVTGLVSGFIDGIIGFFQNLYDRLVGGSIVHELFDSIVEIITTTLATAVATVSTAVGDMIAVFADRISDFISVGEDIILGVIDGIKAKAQALIDAVKGAVQAALDWIAEKLGMGSPSKLFFEIGSDMMSGLTQGIQASQQGVIDSLAGMLAMPMTFAPQLAGGSGGETHYHYEYNEAEGIGADARASLRQQYEAMELYERLRS